MSSLLRASVTSYSAADAETSSGSPEMMHAALVEGAHEPLPLDLTVFSLGLRARSGGGLSDNAPLSRLSADGIAEQLVVDTTLFSCIQV